MIWEVCGHTPLQASHTNTVTCITSRASLTKVSSCLRMTCVPRGDETSEFQSHKLCGSLEHMRLHTPGLGILVWSAHHSNSANTRCLCTCKGRALSQQLQSIWSSKSLRKQQWAEQQSCGKRVPKVGATLWGTISCWSLNVSNADADTSWWVRGVRETLGPSLKLGKGMWRWAGDGRGAVVDGRAGVLAWIREAPRTGLGWWWVWAVDCLRQFNIGRNGTRACKRKRAPTRSPIGMAPNGSVLEFRLRAKG
jgi:hypothetical protein